MFARGLFAVVNSWEAFLFWLTRGVFEFPVLVVCKGKNLAVKAKEEGMGELVRSSHVLLFFLPIYQGAIIL